MHPVLGAFRVMTMFRWGGAKYWCCAPVKKIECKKYTWVEQLETDMITKKLSCHSDRATIPVVGNFVEIMKVTQVLRDYTGRRV